MADITIETSASVSSEYRNDRGGIFWTTPLIGYIIYLDSAIPSNLVYRKTLDGGTTWAAAHVLLATSVVLTYDCWADWQTAGDAGTKINIACMDTTSDDINYIYIDTADDSHGTNKIADCAGNGAIEPSVMDRSGQWISITKTRGGNLAVAFRYYDSAYTELYLFYTSPDGTTWTSKTSPWETTVNDYLLLFPANLADNNDLWAVFWDASADVISLKTYDNSLNDWTTTAEAAIGTATESLIYTQMDGQVRLSDGHLILAYWNLYDNAAADLEVVDITDSTAHTHKTNIITNESESFCVSVFINQVNNDIYVAYFSGTAAGSQVACFYQKSTDGGTNWGGETAMQADAEDDHRWLSFGCMKAAWGGKAQVIWFDDDDNDIFTNVTNGVTIAAAGGGTAWEKNLTDSFSISDSLVKFVSKVRPDTMSIADSPAKFLSKPLADTMTIADSIDIDKFLGIILNDTVTIADTLVKDIRLTKSETLAIADALAKTFGVAHSDALTILDSISKQPGLAKADSMAIADSLSKEPNLRKAENVAIAEAIVKTIGINKSDTVTISDSLTKLVSLVKTDLVIIADSISTFKYILLNLFDTMTITDSIVKTLIKASVRTYMGFRGLLAWIRQIENQPPSMTEYRTQDKPRRTEPKASRPVGEVRICPVCFQRLEEHNGIKHCNFCGYDDE